MERMNIQSGTSKQPIYGSQDSPITKNQRSGRVDQNVFNSGPELGRPILFRPKSKLDCIICMEERVGGKFADCQHQVICLPCAEKLVQNTLDMDKIPKCPIARCEATISTHSDSVYTKFSTKTQNYWKAFDQKSKVCSLGPVYKCQSPDCPGYLHPLTSLCQICQTNHCKHCHREAHPAECIGLSSNLANFQNLKFCKHCASKVFKEGGCPKITCRTCKTVICYECLEEWSLSHHGCQQYGWLKFPFNFFSQYCCSDATVSRTDEVLVQAGASLS